MQSGSLGGTGGSNNQVGGLFDRQYLGHNETTGTTKKNLFFAIVIIWGLAGLAVAGVGLGGYLQAGTLSGLGQVNSIIMMATGGGGTLLLIIGVIGLVKNRQVDNLSNHNTQIEDTENNPPSAPLERTLVLGVENFAVFGAREWEYYYGDVGAQPAYPEGIADILNAQCPFSEDENTKVKDTHMLVLMPATVRGKNLNLNRLEELIKQPNNNGHGANLVARSPLVLDNHGDTSYGQSYWVLMTKDVISGSTNKINAEQQQALVTEKGGENYTLPGALEAAVCILMEHVLDGNKLFGRDPSPTYTRCSETIEGGEDHHVVVGSFGDNGLCVVHDGFFAINNTAYRGVAALRKFLI